MTPFEGLLEHRRAGAARSLLETFRVNAEETEFGAHPSRAGREQAVSPRVLLVGVIGVKHEVGALRPQSREVRIGV